MSVLIYVKKMPEAEPAVRMGGLVARLTGSDVTLLTAVGNKKPAEGGSADLVQAAALLQGLKVDQRERQGDEVKSILAELQTGKYDLVVLLARRAIRYRQRLGRKVARLVAIESPVPVLIVKPGDVPEQLQRILICTGGKEVSNQVIEKGAQLAAAAGAEVTLLHITSPVPSMYTGMEEIEETFEELLQTDTPTARHLRAAAEYLAQKNLQARLEVRQGDVADEILEESREGQHDLIVVGASSRGSRIREWFMGDVTRSLVNHARCPVLVVR